MSRYNSDSICQLGSVRQVLPVVRLPTSHNSNYPLVSSLLNSQHIPHVCLHVFGCSWFDSGFDSDLFTSYDITDITVMKLHALSHTSSTEQ